MSLKGLKCLYITFNGLMDPLGQSQVLPYIEDLNKTGVKFYLISLEKVKDSNRINELSVRLKNSAINWYRLKYFKLRELGMVANIFQCFILSLYLIVFKNIKIIHCRAYPPIFSLFFLKNIFKLKIIFDMRGFWPENLVDSGRIKQKSIYYKMIKFLEKKSILASDWIITLTLEAEEIIKNTYKDKKLKILWMPTCVDEEKFLNKKNISFENRFTMVYSGSLWSFYDMSSMTNLFNSLKSKINNAHFLILGNNQTEKLDQLFLEKGLCKEDYTILTLKSEDVAQYLLSSNFGVAFIYNYYSEKAAFPTKIAEYLASGLPVAISTQCNFLKEIINSNNVGVVMEKFDKESCDTAIETLLVLLKDEKVKERCQAVAKDYLSKKVCINKYLEIYHDLE